MSPARVILRSLVRGYQILVSPFLAPACRFHPTCSAYAIEALDTHGALKGSWLAAKRVARCHPWNDGGFDPVPPLGHPSPLNAGHHERRTT